MWLSAKEIMSKYKITKQTLNNWRKEKQIEFKKINQRKFLYLDTHFDENVRKNVIYARVSNTKQTDDLERQVRFIKEYMIANGVIPDLVFQEISSGMNENRTEFNNLLQLIFEKKINKVYVSYKDRLSRFGVGYFENIFRKFGTEIVVINLTDESSYQQELTEDLVSIIHYFSMKMYSNRRKILKKTKEDILNAND